MFTLGSKFSSSLQNGEMSHNVPDLLLPKHTPCGHFSMNHIILSNKMSDSSYFLPLVGEFFFCKNGVKYIYIYLFYSGCRPICVVGLDPNTDTEHKDVLTLAPFAPNSSRN